ncbi:cation:proton antiporter [Pedobacter sp. P351]|uniref:cation:proton antiporter n=1 Tax=Pedobacter superstes TaxID=3133441 RepID=UPI0030B300EA
MNIVLLSAIDFSLPLKNPVIIFSLVLFIILFAPILFNKIKIPHIVGLIAAGIVIGPYGLNLLLRDSSIVLFGTVGLLYIMFTAGLEIDMEEFKKNRLKSLVFGIFTFILPLVLGSLAAYYMLNFSVYPSILFGSMLSTHTLLAYPIVSKYGIAQIRAVTLTIGGTIVTDILSLLVLAAVTGMTRGDIGFSFWIRLVLGCIIFGCIVFLLFPIIARWFFKRFDDHISQYIFVLAMVFLGSFLAEIAGLEAIIGAFLSGLALNRFIPHVSPLMNRIEFVGNAFFIPFFLIGVGMLVDVSVLFKGLGAITVAAVMILVAVTSKYLAAVFTRKTFNLSKDEQRLIFGLSNARVGATLAIVLIGYNIILAETASGEPIRLLNEDVLNGAVLMILVTCTISSFVVEKAAQVIALKEESSFQTQTHTNERILISFAYPETVSDLVDFGLMLKPHKSDIPVYALHVTLDDNAMDNSGVDGKKMMVKALKHASATGNVLIPITRFDINISHGIIYTIKEHNITDVLIGLHHNSDQQAFFGPTAEKILKSIQDTIYIYKPSQPFNTLKKMVVLVPDQAELEPGFVHWFDKLTTIAKSAGMPITFYAGDKTLAELKIANENTINGPAMQFNEFNNWEDFLIFSRELKSNEFFVIINSRYGNVSYNQYLEKLPYYLSSYFQNNSFMILYPRQLDQNPVMEDILKSDSSVLGSIANEMRYLRSFGNSLKKIFRK